MSKRHNVLASDYCTTISTDNIPQDIPKQKKRIPVPTHTTGKKNLQRHLLHRRKK